MKRFADFLTEKNFWGDSWSRAKAVPPEYDTQEADPALDQYRAKAIQALTELRERTQDADFQEILDSMMQVIKKHSMPDPQDGPMGTATPHQSGDVWFGQDQDLEGDQLPIA